MLSDAAPRDDPVAGSAPPPA
ncbi:hypothetical protein CFC21_068040, partial [Triticum aestivum]